MPQPDCGKIAFVGAGANLGDRQATLERAAARLAGWPGVLSVESSSVYETQPVGPIAQPMFLNLVVALETRLTPEELLAALLEIEREFGRVRMERWGPRTLDLDLLLFEDATVRTTKLELPHPRMFERAFVRVPLQELLERPRFSAAKWESLRVRLASRKNNEGVQRLPECLGGERS